MNLNFKIPMDQVNGIDAAIRVAIERNKISRKDIILVNAGICEPTREYEVNVIYHLKTLCIGGPEDGNYTTHTGTVFMSGNVTYKLLHYPGEQDVYVPAVWDQGDVMRALIAVYGKKP